MGFDPGASPGWGMIETSPLQLVEFGQIKTDPELRMACRVYEIFQSLHAIISQHLPLILVCERPFTPRGWGNCEAGYGAWAAASIAACENGMRFVEYTPQQIKSAICPKEGRKGATKEEMQAAVAEILGLDDLIRPHHANDAVAVSISHFLSVKGHSNDK